VAETPPPEFLDYLHAQMGELPPEPSILEIGGGSATHVRCPGARYTVVDNSPEVLARCSYAEEKLLADAESFDPGPRKFDLVVFWNVLEHLADPRGALVNAARAVRHDGLLIARGPELRSLKAIVTRNTPHWFHILFYRRVLGFRNAGRNGEAPFPVEHKVTASPEAIKVAVVPLKFGVDFEQRYVGDQLRLLEQYSRLAHRLYEAASAGLRLVSRGRLGARHTDFILAFRRQG